MNGKETKSYRHFLQTKLKQGETPLLFLEGWIGEMMGKGKDAQHNGAFILTDQRAVFCAKELFGEVFEAIGIEKISSVESRSFMGHRVLALHTSNDELRFKTFEAADLFEKVYTRVEELRHVANASASAASPAPAAAPSAADEIERFAALKEKGLITDEEFQAKKRQLLGL